MAGEPFLAHQLRLLHAHGFRRVVALRRAISARCIERGSWRWRARFGMRLGVFVRRPKSCWAPAARSSGRCRCWASAFVVLYGDSYLPMDYAAAVGAIRGERQTGADDGLPQSRPSGTRAMWSSPTARSTVTIKKISAPEMQPHRLWFGHPARGYALAAYPEGRGVRSGGGLPRPVTRGKAGRVTRCGTVFTKLARTRVWRNWTRCCGVGTFPSLPDDVQNA